MARCGCGTSDCNCRVVQGTNVTVTGSGSPTNPYVVSANVTLNVADTETVTLDYTGNVLTANAVVSPAAGNRLSTDGTGLFVPAITCADVAGCVALQVADTASLDLTLTGTGTAGDPWVLSGIAGGEATTVANTDSVALTLLGTQITADVIPDNTRAVTVDANGVGVCLSTDGGNVLAFGSDGCLFAAAGAGNIFNDTNSVGLVTTGNVITANVIRDPAAGNILTIGPNGVLVDLISGPCGLSGQGTAASPLIANVAAWPFGCPQDANALGVYCSPTTGRLQVDPPFHNFPAGTAADGINTGGTAPAPALAVPTVLTVVDTASITITNPDPCRALRILIVWEAEANFQIVPGARIDFGMQNDDMAQMENTGTSTMTWSVQQTRGELRVLPAGGTANFPFTIDIQRFGAAGSTMTRTQWRVTAFGQSYQ